MAKQKLSEVLVTAIPITSNDRVLVRMKKMLIADQMRNIRIAIEKWAGEGVPVLFLDENLMELIVVEKP